MIEGPVTKAVQLPFAPNWRELQASEDRHPAIEHVTMISGTLTWGHDKLDTQKIKALTPGRTAIMQPKTNHFAGTGEEAEV